MFDIWLLFLMAFAGGLIALISFITILGRKIAEPKDELQKKVQGLEEEVERLKNNRD
ncbi:hypothetical protein [Tuberibacillus sp. Marseille-P3662]|uniref:hypothetical protein n=1 Tax=Tuberibacillus sp. Marseille-P3662 TaxID=1965358 RepID=UPI001594320B|nr:hypothetical protein [Tuberibacillus sp. Marseille-P3662]